jgi:hypothetical protein
VKRPAGALALAVVLVGCGGSSPHADAVEVAEAYLDAVAAVDVRALCETYSADSRQEEFAHYDDVEDCAAYEVAFIRDDTSGYRVTETMEQDFEIGEAIGDDQRVEVAFVATLTYTGDNEAARQYYDENPTVPGAVVLVRDSDGWGVDAAATQASFYEEEE